MNGLITRSTEIIAAEINSIKDQTRKMVLYNSIEIGRRLTEAKLMLPHGEWSQWLQVSVDYSPTTARNLMRIFEEYGSNQLSLFGDNAKSQALANLTYTQAVTLLGVPSDEREYFIENNDIDNMSTRELQKVVKEKQELERRLRESEEETKKERQYREEIASRHKDLEKQNKTHEKLVARLNKELEEAKAAGDDTEVERLQHELDHANSDLETARSRIKDLEDALNKKSVDIATAVVEKIPEEIEKELIELRKKVNQKSSEPMIKFSYCFESLVNGFKELLGALNAIKEVDSEEHEKYKNAVNGLIEKMTERL